MLLGLLLAALLSSDDGVVLCPYRRCTGGDCPLCGVTRAGGDLLRGEVGQSWQTHPLAIILATQTILVVAAVQVPSAARWLRRHRSAALLANVALATVIWMVRLALGLAAPPAGLWLPF